VRSLGFNPTKEEVFQMASEFASDDDDEISLSFDEFLFLMAAKMVSTIISSMLIN
jgi:Ca2+-binding EF-hand superfamily protein